MRHANRLEQARVPVSLIIVTFDSSEDIGACLEAVRAQQGTDGFETIVVDNGSRDGTVDLIRRRFPQVRLIQQSNVGFGSGINRGVKEARGDVVVFLNPDTVPEPGFLVALGDAVGPSQAATAQVVLKQDPGRINTAGHRLHFTGYGFVVDYDRPRWRPGAPRITQGISGAAFAMRREDFLRVGGFDEDFFLYMEDTELSWRMQRAGFRLVVAPDAVMTHDYVPGLPSQKIAYLEAGRLLLLRKHLPWFLWLAYAPSLLVAEGLAWVRAAWLGRAGLAAKWQGLRKGLRPGIRKYPHLPRARPHRFASQGIPFGMLSGWRAVAVVGEFVNLLFRLNTLSWFFRKDRIRIRWPD